MVATASRKISKEEYLDFEYGSKIRHEYINGQIKPTPYTTKNHGRIAQNMSRHLGNCLTNSNFEVYQESRMLHVPNCERFYYPDLLIVPLEVETFVHKQKMEADLYPTALIEVSSESTEDQDKDAKWKCYQEIKTLQEYMLISQFEKFVQLYVRQENGSTKWIYSSYSDDEELVPISLCTISLKDIYDRVIYPIPEHKSDS